MTEKKRQFPLPLSSLQTKAPDGTKALKASKVFSTLELTIKTPQTATQNARQHMVKNAVKSGEEQTEDKHALSTGRRPDFHVVDDSSSKKVMSLHTSFDAPRRAMTQRLVKQGIKDEAVLAAMGTVPRHQFVEPGLIAQAYVDASLPIGHQQTISQPYIVARMIELMRNGKKLNQVLEIGTGCGYQAAVLAQLSDHVYSIERIKLLHELAKKNLRSLRIANLRLHYGDGMHGIPQIAPFDGIILAAAGMQIPDALLQQLAIGGRLIAPIGEQQQVLQLIERTGNATWTKTELETCYFVPLRPGII